MNLLPEDLNGITLKLSSQDANATIFGASITGSFVNQYPPKMRNNDKA